MAGKHGGARKGAGRKPGAVSRAKKDLAEAAKAHAEDALAVLVEIAKDSEAPHSARVSAANAIIDRGYGKPFTQGPGDDGEHKHAFTFGWLSE